MYHCPKKRNLSSFITYRTMKLTVYSCTVCSAFRFVVPACCCCVLLLSSLLVLSPCSTLASVSLSLRQSTGFTGSIDTMFRIPSWSITNVVSETFSLWYGPVVQCTSILYVHVAIAMTSVYAIAVIGGVVTKSLWPAITSVVDWTVTSYYCLYRAWVSIRRVLTAFRSWNLM